MNAFLSVVVEIARGVGGNIVRLLPFLAISIPIAVYLNHAGVSASIRKVIDRGPVLSVLLATLIGALGPLCSCGVIPVIAALLAGGMPLAPVMSFWLASPSMDPEILLLSGATIGWELAVWRLAATFAMSFGAGLIVMVLERRNVFATGVLRAQPAGLPMTAKPAPEPALAFANVGAFEGVGSADPVSVDAASVDTGKESGPARRSVRPDMRAIGIEILKYAIRLVAVMTVAFVLEEIITRFVPIDVVAALLGRKVPWAVPLATLVGIPMYATNLTALGAVTGFLERGMDPAAALSFFVAGAVTTIPAIAAVVGIVRPKVFALYLTFAFTGALAAGYLWKLFHGL